jgi:hypothetical protein
MQVKWAVAASRFSGRWAMTFWWALPRNAAAAQGAVAPGDRQ